MKQAIYLQKVQKEMIKTSMRFYRERLSGLGKDMFDISFSKINEMDGTRVELDGMEMIYIAQSLNSYAKYLSAYKKYIESYHFRIFASEFEEIRIHFQRMNGPKIKAASAGTLTA